MFLLPEFAVTGKGDIKINEIITGFPAKLRLFCYANFEKKKEKKMRVLITIGFWVGLVIAALIAGTLYFNGFVEKFWTPVFATLFSAALVWVAYKSYDREQPKLDVLIQVADTESDITKSFMSASQIDQLKAKKIEKVLICAVTNVSRVRIVVTSLASDKNGMLLPLVSKEFKGFGCPLEQGEQKIETLPITGKVAEDLRAACYLAVQDSAMKEYRVDKKKFKKIWEEL